MADVIVLDASSGSDMEAASSVAAAPAAWGGIAGSSVYRDAVRDALAMVSALDNARPPQRKHQQPRAKQQAPQAASKRPRGSQVSTLEQEIRRHAARAGNTRVKLASRKSTIGAARRPAPVVSTRAIARAVPPLPLSKKPMSAREETTRGRRRMGPLDSVQSMPSLIVLSSSSSSAASESSMSSLSDSDGSSSAVSATHSRVAIQKSKTELKTRSPAFRQRKRLRRSDGAPSPNTSSSTKIPTPRGNPTILRRPGVYSSVLAVSEDRAKRAAARSTDTSSDDSRASFRLVVPKERHVTKRQQRHASRENDSSSESSSSMSCSSSSPTKHSISRTSDASRPSTPSQASWYQKKAKPVGRKVCRNATLASARDDRHGERKHEKPSRPRRRADRFFNADAISFEEVQAQEAEFARIRMQKAVLDTYSSQGSERIGCPNATAERHEGETPLSTAVDLCSSSDESSCLSDYGSDDTADTKSVKSDWDRTDHCELEISPVRSKHRRLSQSPNLLTLQRKNKSISPSPDAAVLRNTPHSECRSSNISTPLSYDPVATTTRPAHYRVCDAHVSSVRHRQTRRTVLVSRSMARPFSTLCDRPISFFGAFLLCPISLKRRRRSHLLLCQIREVSWSRRRGS